jgi:hypothetical protein
MFNTIISGIYTLEMSYKFFPRGYMKTEYGPSFLFRGRVLGSHAQNFNDEINRVTHTVCCLSPFVEFPCFLF